MNNSAKIASETSSSSIMNKKVIERNGGTHIDVDALKWKHPRRRRLLGYEAIKLLVASIPLDGVEKFPL